MSPDGYELHDGRFIQETGTVSAANAITVSAGTAGVCPAGKIRTILAACYYPSVAETRTVFWQIISRSGAFFAVTRPISVALSPTIMFPLVTEGMEIKLFPGEQLYCQRDVATAGSTMTLLTRFIETDLPFYSHEEPLNKVIRSTQKHSTLLRGGGGGGGRSGPGSGPGGGGGGGGPEPR